MKILTIMVSCLVIFGCAGSHLRETQVSNTLLPTELEKEIALPLPADINSFVADPIPSNSHWPDYKITRQILEEVLAEWHQISKEQWQHGYSHVGQEDRTGKIMLKDGDTVNWMIKPGGLAMLVFENGTTVYVAKELIR